MLASELERVIGNKAYTTDGEKIGKVGSLYLDDYTEEPTFVTVETGLFGTKESFVPVREARVTDEDLVVPYDKDTVKDAPNVDAGGHLSPEQERELFDYYDLTFVQRPEAAEETDRVRLRRYVVTDDRADTAPVRRERVAGQEPVADEVRVEPIDTDNRR